MNVVGHANFSVNASLRVLLFQLYGDFILLAGFYHRRPNIIQQLFDARSVERAHLISYYLISREVNAIPVRLRFDELVDV